MSRLIIVLFGIVCLYAEKSFSEPLLFQTLSATPKLTLAWDDSNSNEDGFTIERKDGLGGIYAAVGTVGTDVLTFQDFSVSADTLYCYRVRAFNQTAVSDYSNETCAAPQAVYSLEVIKSGAGTGSVSSSPAGVSCGADCSEPYFSGTVVTLSAQPEVGSVFTGWSGAGCSGTGNCLVTMSADSTVTASFAPASYNLTVNKSGSGTGNVTSVPGGISCGTDCSESYLAGTRVTLNAMSSGGSSFVGWTGGGCSGTGSCIVTMNAASSVTATFSVNQSTLLVSKAGAGQGLVTSSPGGINCGTDCSESYVQGASVTLTATNNPNSVFVGWSGACSGTGTCTVNMSSNQAVTATFNLVSYPLNIVKTGSGAGTVTNSTGEINCGQACTASFFLGTTVTLTAVAAPGSNFVGWTGACAGQSPTCQLLITSATNVSAEFEAQIFVFGINAGGGNYVASDGTQYIKDQYFSGGSKKTYAGPVGGTSEVELYKTYRTGNKFSYKIPVGNGMYEVKLHFFDPTSTAAKKRQFNVSLEGQVTISNLDIFSLVGRRNALVLTQTISVTDGSLDIAFAKGSKGTPVVSAILIKIMAQP